MWNPSKEMANHFLGVACFLPLFSVYGGRIIVGFVKEWHFQSWAWSLFFSLRKFILCGVHYIGWRRPKALGIVSLPFCYCCLNISHVLGGPSLFRCFLLFFFFFLFSYKKLILLLIIITKEISFWSEGLWFKVYTCMFLTNLSII